MENFFFFLTPWKSILSSDHVTVLSPAQARTLQETKRQSLGPGPVALRAPGAALTWFKWLSDSRLMYVPLECMFLSKFFSAFLFKINILKLLLIYFENLDMSIQSPQALNELYTFFIASSHFLGGRR